MQGRPQAQYQSALPGVAWPAFPGGDGPLVLALLHQLAGLEWSPPGCIEQGQMRQLRLLVDHAVRTMPFWRERLERCGMPPEHGPMPEWLRTVPLLERAVVQAEGERLFCPSVPPGHGGCTEGVTSGSTGMPVRFLKSGLANLMWRAFTLRDHEWHGRDFAGKLAAIRMGVAEAESGGWGAATDGLVFTGPSATLGITADLGYQLAWLERQDPDYLLSFPSNLDALARLSLERGARLPRLREVRSISEALSPDTRIRVREAWGVEVKDTYSTQEVGCIALQCPLHEHYHVQAEGAIVEILRGDGSPCAPGETGEVVVTPLHNFAMPLIRYRLGDLAEAGAPCPCGRGLPVLSRIYGRVRNMLTLPDGQRHWPSLGTIRDAAPHKILQYQFVQRSLAHIEVLLVVAGPLSAGEERALCAIAREALGYPFELTLVYRDRLLRSATGKFEEFRSEIGAAP